VVLARVLSKLMRPVTIPLDLNGSAKVPYGSFDHVLVTKDCNPLEPSLLEHKYYVAGVGNVMEISVKGPPERIELVEVKSTS
jgi:hypothetical protein